MRAYAVLLAALFTTATLVAAQLTMPTPAESYSAVVAINFDVGFTISFNEFYDATTQRLRTDGRFTPSEVTELIDFRNQVLYQWQPLDITKACTAINISASAGVVNPMLQALLRPSREYLLRAPGLAAPAYVGVSTAARTINANLWSAEERVETDLYKSQGTDLYYWTLPDGNGITTPIRLERKAKMTTRPSTADPWTDREVNDFYDWVYVVPEKPLEQYFTLPARCQGVRIAQTAAQAAADGVSAGSIFNISIPTTSTVKPLPVNPPTPGVGSLFRLVLESKLTAGAQAVTAMKWYVNADQKERIDYLDADHKEISLIYDYTRTPPIVYNNSAATGCFTRELSSTNASPLYARAGSLPRLFGGFPVDPTFFINPTYENRSVARGVIADVFMQRERQLVNPYLPTASFNFDMSVSFFPEGWQFPGREGVEAGLRLPLRILNNGSMTQYNAQAVPIATTAYTDVWDIFQYIPKQPEDYTFDAVNNFGCDVDPPKPPETYSTSNAGTIAGAIVGVLLGLALAYGGYRWWKTHKKQFHANIQGMAKATDDTAAGSAGAPAGAQRV